MEGFDLDIIELATTPKPVQVPALVIGCWAAHKAIGLGNGHTITHVPTGRCGRDGLTMQQALMLCQLLAMQPIDWNFGEMGSGGDVWPREAREVARQVNNLVRAITPEPTVKEPAL
jgi:hypothetical protein